MKLHGNSISAAQHCIFQGSTHHEIITVIIIVNDCDGLMLALLFYCQLFFLC